ncbi:hypothetical protein DOY81_014275, partial [Sarcophaga bullata]
LLCIFFLHIDPAVIEGISPTSVGPNLIAALSSGDATFNGHLAHDKR